MVGSGKTCRRAVLMAWCGLLAGIVPAVARPDAAPVAAVRVERILTAAMTITPDGRLLVSDAGGVERRMAASGDVIADTALEPDDGAPLEPLGEFRCVGQGRTGAGFTDHSRAEGPARLEVDGFGGGIRSAFWAYSLDPARLAGQNRRPTRQVQICMAGGASAADGWRLLQAGAAAAYDEPDVSFRLAMDWPEGATPREATGGFQLGSPAKAGVVGRIAQEPEQQLAGSSTAPVPSEVDGFFDENGVAGWWQDRCLDEAACTLAGGSDRFHGNLAYAVWEYLPDEIPPGGLRFHIAAYAVFACAPGMEGCYEEQHIA